MLAVLLLATAVAARRLGRRAETGAYAAALSGVAVGLGALVFAGTLCGDGYRLWPGLLGGLVCAGLANAVVRSILAGAAARLDHDAASALWLFAEGAALVLAGVSILIPPIAIPVLLLLAGMLISRQRGDGGKYAGLRILR